MLKKELNQMSKFTRTPILTLSIVAACVLALLGLFLLRSEESSAAPHKGKYGAIEFVVSDDTNGKRAMISYSRNSKDDLVAYASTNQDLLYELVGQGAKVITGQIVFVRPLGPDEFTQIVSDYDVSVESYVLRGISNSGERITIFGAPSDAELIPSPTWQQSENILKAKNEQTRIAGVITVEGQIKTANAQRLLRDERVFVVDVSTEFVRRQLQVEFEGNTPVRVDNLFPLYWFLEDYGIAKSQ